MNKQETTQLLALIKVAYPTAYRDMDEVTKKATVNMWAGAFPDMPYPIMEQAFNHFRMRSKFPPTVAEMVDELKHIHYQAEENALINHSMGNYEEVKHYQAIMAITLPYKDSSNLGLRLGKLPNLLTGGQYDTEKMYIQDRFEQRHSIGAGELPCPSDYGK